MSNRVKDRLILALYLAAVVTITCVHDPHLLLAGVALTIPLAGRSWPRVAARAGVAILLFNSIVTVSYWVIATRRGDFTLDYVALINLRVFLLTTLTFILKDRINLFRALAFSPTMLFLLTLAYSQILGLRRVVEEFQLARRSRTLARPSLGDLSRHGAATAAFLLQKATADATEIAQAMRSRGFFDD